METALEARDGPTLPQVCRAILCPTDFGPAAREAWLHALALGRAFGAPVRVLHVVEILPADYETDAMGFAFPTVEATLRHAAERQLEPMRAEAAAAGVTMAAEVAVGRVRTEILRVAGASGATLIVMGVGGVGRVLRALLGSVTEWVARRARCPVLIVGQGVRRPRAVASAGPAAGRERPASCRPAAA